MQGTWYATPVEVSFDSPERSQVENHQSRWDTEMFNIHPRMWSFFSPAFPGFSASPYVTASLLSPTPRRNSSSHPMGGVGWVRRGIKEMSYSKTIRTPFRRTLGEQSLNAEDTQSLLPLCGLWQPWCLPILLCLGGFKTVVAPSTLVSL